MIMAGMSGSDLADAAATGSILIPGMRKAGYPPAYAASLIAGAATIGPLVPPSVAFIIFAAATDTSVGRLFLGGATPGIMLGGFLMVQAYVVARMRNYPREVKRTGAERARATFVSIPALTIPVIVLGSILGGIATPTEAAVVGVVAVTAAGTLFLPGAHGERIHRGNRQCGPYYGLHTLHHRQRGRVRSHPDRVRGWPRTWSTG